MMNILVVDDYPMNRLKLARMVEQLGYSASMADDGTTAVNIMHTEPIDIVLLDIVMPDMDGIEVLKAIQADHTLKDIIVIVVSGDDDMATIEAAKDLGAVGYLTKPIDVLLLQEMLLSHQG